MKTWIRTCQECLFEQQARAPDTCTNDLWRELKCKRCKSPALNYGNEKEIPMELINNSQPAALIVPESNSQLLNGWPRLNLNLDDLAQKLDSLRVPLYSEELLFAYLTELNLYVHVRMVDDPESGISDSLVAFHASSPNGYISKEDTEILCFTINDWIAAYAGQTSLEFVWGTLMDSPRFPGEGVFVGVSDLPEDDSDEEDDESEEEDDEEEEYPMDTNDLAEFLGAPVMPIEAQILLQEFADAHPGYVSIITKDSPAASFKILLKDKPITITFALESADNVESFYVQLELTNNSGEIKTKRLDLQFFDIDSCLGAVKEWVASKTQE